MDKFKKFLNYFNFMELNLSARSYKSCFIRMAVSLLIMFTVLIIRFSITIANPALNVATLFVILAVVILCVLCFFTAAVECLQVGDNRKKDKERQNRMMLQEVYAALLEKGYNPINQIVGYLLSEDPTYITNYKNARSLIRKIDRDDLLGAMLREYLQN